VNNTFHQEHDFEDETYDERMAYEQGYKRMANPNLNRGGGFLFPNHDKRISDSSPNEYMIKFEIPSFSGNLNIESFLDWVYKVKKFFDMNCISSEKHVKLVAYKLKKGGDVWWD